jgi:hypothetical protein
MITTANFGGVLPALTDQKGTTITNIAAFFALIDAHAAHCDLPFVMKEIDTPESPTTGYNALYFKSDDKLYKKTSAGVESEIASEGAGDVIGAGTPADHQLPQYNGTGGKAIEPGPIVRTSVRSPASASDAEITGEKGVSSAIVAAQMRKATMLISGGGSVITIGIKGGFECPITGHITAARIASLDATSGAIAIAVWIEPYAGGVPENADEVDIFSIAASGTQSEETGLAIAVTVGDWIAFNVDSVTSMKLIAISLTIEAV